MARGIFRSGSARLRGSSTAAACATALSALATAAVAIAALPVLLSVTPATAAVPVSKARTKRRRGQNGRVGSDPHPDVQGAQAQPTWSARLLKSPRLQARLILLSNLGLSDAEIAEVYPDGGNSARSLQRWRREGMAQDREAARWKPADNLCAIIGYLMSDGTFDEDATVAWLRSRHAELGQRRPLEVLGAGDFDLVLGAARSSLGIVVRGEDDAPGPVARALAANRGSAGEPRTAEKPYEGEQQRVAKAC